MFTSKLNEEHVSLEVCVYTVGIHTSKLLPNCYLYIPTSTVRKMNGSARILWKTEPLLQNFLGYELYVCFCKACIALYVVWLDELKMF